VLIVILTITARGLYAVLTVIVTIMIITGRSILDAKSYFDNNGVLYMQC
jgi:hypothetical protein